MADSPTLAYLLGQMAQDLEVLNGSDAVLNILESALNAFLQSQYAAFATRPGGFTVAQVFCGPPLTSPHGDYCIVTAFSFTLGPPAFTFATAGQDAVVQVVQPVTAGFTQSGTMPVDSGYVPASCGCVVDDPRVTWGPVQNIDPSAGPTVSATAPLAFVGGIVAPNAQTVVLDFAAGAFTLGNIVIAGVTAQQLSDQIAAWFLNNDVQYQLASFETGGGASPALTPTRFALSVLNTNAGNTIVQILITTNGTPASGLPIVLEPIPTADGYSCSLMISSRIVFSNILCAGFDQGTRPYQLIPQCAASGVWSAYISPEMNFSGSFSYGSCCAPTTVTYNIYLGGTYTGTQTQGFYLYQSVTPSGNVGDTITVTAYNPVSLSGSGAAQVIRITPQAPDVQVTGGASDTINSELQSILNNDFQGAMAGISFAPVTTFALQTILFPGNLMNMQVVQVPTDLLIVGTFQPN